MAEKFIPFEKLSKKEKAKRNKKQRKVWTMNSITRCPPPPQAYDRNKAKRDARKDVE